MSDAKMDKNDDFKKPDPLVVKQKLKDKWLKAWFAIEVFAVNKETAEAAMREHVKNMCKSREIMVLERKFDEISEREYPVKGESKKGYSQTAEITFICKTFTDLLNMVMLYGPSAIEVLEPNAKEITIDELQNIANILSGVLHQFAAAGIGGLVIRSGKQDN